MAAIHLCICILFVISFRTVIHWSQRDIRKKNSNYEKNSNCLHYGFPIIKRRGLSPILMGYDDFSIRCLTEIAFCIIHLENKNQYRYPPSGKMVTMTPRSIDSANLSEAQRAAPEDGPTHRPSSFVRRFVIS